MAVFHLFLWLSSIPLYICTTEVSHTENNQESYGCTDMWDRKLKTTNEQTRQTNKNSWTQTIVWWLPEEKGSIGRVVKGKGSNIQ